jgi:hypothetical protein
MHYAPSCCIIAANASAAITAASDFSVTTFPASYTC